MNHLKSIIYAFLTVLLFAVPSMAQMLQSNNTLLVVAAGTQLTVKGDVNLMPGATIVNNGTIDLNGHWVNNSGTPAFITSSGTVEMNGVNQTISGLSVTVFYNLKFLNGTKTLLTDITTGGHVGSPAGSLHLNNAILHLKSHTLRVNNVNPNGITRTTGYILSEDADNSSRVWWAFLTQGLHTIPFGNSSGADVSFSFLPLIQPTGSYTSDLIVSTYATLPDNTPLPTTPNLVTHVNGLSGFDNSANTVDRFWHITKNGTADFYFTYAPAENAANGNINMRAQRWDSLSLGWDLSLAGQTNPTLQKVAVPAVPSNGTWTIAMESTPLPISLIEFNARIVDGKNVKCEWITASEINNDYFLVQRSADGQNFETIGQVDGAGNSSQLLKYDFTDLSPFTGKSYYRLKQYDFNGSFTCTKSVAVNFLKDGLSFQLFPNPVSDVCTISFDQPINISKVMITDLTNKVIYSEGSFEKSTKFSIDLSAFPAGTYIISIETGDGKLMREKIVVMH